MRSVGRRALVVRVESLTGKMLLVVKDTDEGQLWADALRRQGMQIVVRREDDLLSVWAEDGFDLSVVDTDDHQAGLALCERLRQKTANPILLLAAECDDFRCVGAYRAGVDECIEKPISLAVLMAKVRAWLRHSRTMPAGALAQLATVSPGDESGSVGATGHAGAPCTGPCGGPQAGCE